MRLQESITDVPLQNVARNSGLEDASAPATEGSQPAAAGEQPAASPPANTEPAREQPANARKGTEGQAVAGAGAGAAEAEEEEPLCCFCHRPSDVEVSSVGQLLYIPPAHQRSISLISGKLLLGTLPARDSHC